MSVRYVPVTWTRSKMLYDAALVAGVLLFLWAFDTAALRAGGVPCTDVLKIQEGRPNAADLMRNGEVGMLFITSTGDEPDVRDGKDLRRLALSLKLPVVTTVAGAQATAAALAGMAEGTLQQVPIQDYFPKEA